MMRAILVRLARRTPPSLITDRLMPWLTLCLGALGAAWALVQYSNSVAIQRAQTTLEIHRQFLVTFPDGAQEIIGLSPDEMRRAIYQTRCRAYRSAMTRGVMPPDDRLKRCTSIDLTDKADLDDIGAVAPSEVRNDIRQALETTLKTQSAPAKRMMTYFRSLQVCVERRRCDQGITLELFAGEIVAFLNLTCDLASRDPDFLRLGAMLAGFTRQLLDHGALAWNTDPQREDIFRCAHLRA